MAAYSPRQKAKKLSKKEQGEIVKRVRENLDDAYVGDRKNRTEAETDFQFLAGDQWPDAVKKARGTDRPMLTVNQLPQFVRQVVNPTREADIAIKVVGVDSAADPQVAQIYDGLIRQIEYLSGAKAVYTAGNEHQAACGIGWWRLCTQYVDDAVFEQEIVLDRINNPLTVYCDPAAVKPTREDAMWMAVVEPWTLKKFKEKFPEASTNGVDVPDTPTSPNGLSWSSKEVVMVAEYYEKVPETRTLAQLVSGEVIDITSLGPEELAQIGGEEAIVGARDCETHRIVKYLVSGAEVLEGPIDWAGRYIPLIPVIGAEIPLREGVLRYGVVRFARDPQQLMNFYRTAAAESIALAPKAPYLVSMKQIGPFKPIWDSANKENRPYLPYVPDQEVSGGRPSREHPPETPVALVQQGEVASEDLKRVTGIYDASLGNRSNETSGVAIARRDAQGSTANSHYADNLFQSLVHTGRVLVDLIPKIYDTQRVVRLMDPQGKEQLVEINKVVMAIDGQPIIVNDLSVGRFDVRVTVGKAYLTKRIEALQAMTELAKGLPPDMQVLLLDLIVRNSDWPGAEELAKRFRNMVPPQALADPNDPDAPKPPSPMDDPTVVASLEKLAAEIEKLKADAAKVQAEIGKTEADTLKTLAEADNLDAETDHQIIIPSLTGRLPGAASNGAQAPPVQ